MLLRGSEATCCCDVRVHPGVHERHAGGVADEAEAGSFDDTGVHGGAPFDGQAEAETGLRAQRASVAADVRGPTPCTARNARPNASVEP